MQPSAQLSLLITGIIPGLVPPRRQLFGSLSAAAASLAGGQIRGAANPPPGAPCSAPEEVSGGDANCQRRTARPGPRGRSGANGPAQSPRALPPRGHSLRGQGGYGGRRALHAKLGTILVLGVLGSVVIYGRRAISQISLGEAIAWAHGMSGQPLAVRGKWARGYGVRLVGGLGAPFSRWPLG